MRVVVLRPGALIRTTTFTDRTRRIRARPSRVSVSRTAPTRLERPLAIVMVGGLVTSTLFTLLALPAFYDLVHRLGVRWRARRAT